MQNQLRYESSSDDPSWTAAILVASMSGLSSVDTSTIERLEIEMKEELQAKQAEMVARRQKRAEMQLQRELRMQQEALHEAHLISELEKQRLARAETLKEDLLRRMRERDAEKAFKMKELKEALLGRESLNHQNKVISSPRTVQAMLDTLPSVQAELQQKVTLIEADGIDTLSNLLEKAPKPASAPKGVSFLVKRKEFSRHNHVTRDIYTSVTKISSWSP